MAELTFTFPNNEVAAAICGLEHKHIQILGEALDLTLVARGNAVTIRGDEEHLPLGQKALEELLFLYGSTNRIEEQQVRVVGSMLRRGNADELHAMLQDTLNVTMKGRVIVPKTEGQKAYVDSIRKNTITFGIGPAGTGKTFLAVTMAAFYLKNRDVDKIILTRPAVEAGERLGYLPGDLQEKVDPYLRPLYDALHDMFGVEQVQRLMMRGTIEVAPLAYMRGRTLERAFIILDEAQNTTPEQMKMFLTRLGTQSKMVINGDKTQVDLPPKVKSGLAEAEKVLADVKSIRRIYFSDQDVVRHDLVGRIVKAYDAYYAKQQKED